MTGSAWFPEFQFAVLRFIRVWLRLTVSQPYQRLNGLPDTCFYTPGICFWIPLLRVSTAERLMLPTLPIVHQKGEKVNKNIWFSTRCLKILIELSDPPAGENIAP